ncbi:MAG: pilus assembly protein [Hyphomicrobiales bacterium]
MRSPDFKPLLNRFWRSHRGNVGIIFAFAVVPLIVGAGIAVDYGNAARVKTRLNAAADAAVLASAKTASQQLQAGATNWKTLGITAGTNLFSVDSLSVSNVVVAAPTISISQSGSTVTASLSYTAQYQTVFAKILGMTTIKLANTETASSGSSVYIDVHIVIQNSESMGIGATAADQTTMQNAIGCTVACHYNDVYGDVVNEPQAHAAGATMRIDVARTGVVNALNILKSMSGSGNIRVALYTMSNSLTVVYPLSTNISGAITAAQTIDLAQVVQQGGTNTTYSLTQLNSHLATAGSGTSAATPSGVVMIMSDGVQDSTYEETSSTPGQVQAISDPNWVPYSPYQDFSVFAGDPIEQGFDPGPCAPIKTKGYTIETLNVQYLVPTIGNSPNDQPRFDFVTSHLLPAISCNLTSCASSPANALLAITPSDIQAAFTKMATSVQSLRLTQ